MTTYASAVDHEICRQIHRGYGTTYYFATRRFTPKLAQRVHAIYSFVRVPDEWVDNPGSLTREEAREKLRDWRQQYTDGLNGRCPKHPAMRAFCDVALESSFGIEEPFLFLDAMEMDLDCCRYQTFEELRRYMRGSAASVGMMMCYAMKVEMTPNKIEAAMALGEAMQLTNFLRDISEDLDRGRIYLPLEECEAFGVDPTQRVCSPEFVELMNFQIARARRLYIQADTGIRLLPPSVAKPVLLARILYSNILDRIEEMNYDVFSARARTSLAEKLFAAAQVTVGLPTQLTRAYKRSENRPDYHNDSAGQTQLLMQEDSA